MKNKGLIIGGVAVLAIVAFLLVRKRKAMASEDATMGEGKSDTETGGTGSTTTGGTGSTNTGGTGSTTTGGTGSTTTGGTGSTTPTPSVNVIPMQLTLKPINNAVDLQGTKLAADVVLIGAGPARLAKVTQAIARLNSVGRSVLNYISDTDSLQRATPEFAKGLDAKVGVGASKDNFAERLVLYLRNNSANWNSSIPQPFPPATSTSSFDGVYFTTPQGEHAYTQQGFEIDKEDYGFNGDNLL
jgi:hypothetical protein